MKSAELEIPGSRTAEPAEAGAVKQVDLAAEVGEAGHSSPDQGLRTLFGGVAESDWPEADQKRMSRGKKPRGHPEHSNT